MEQKQYEAVEPFDVIAQLTLRVQAAEAASKNLRKEQDAAGLFLLVVLVGMSISWIITIMVWVRCQ